MTGYLMSDDLDPEPKPEPEPSPKLAAQFPEYKLICGACGLVLTFRTEIAKFDAARAGKLRCIFCRAPITGLL
jgi:hypothetical protein